VARIATFGASSHGILTRMPAEDKLRLQQQAAVRTLMRNCCAWVVRSGQRAGHGGRAPTVEEDSHQGWSIHRRSRRTGDSVINQVQRA